MKNLLKFLTCFVETIKKIGFIRKWFFTKYRNDKEKLEKFYGKEEAQKWLNYYFGE